MSNITERLLELKTRIEKTKEARAQVEGELTALKKRMEKEFGMNDVKVLTKWMNEVQTRIEKLEAQIETGLTALEKELEKIR